MRKLSILSLINKLLAVVIPAIIPFYAMAHTGHDHNHWLSGFYHLSTVLALAIGLSALLYYFFKRAPKIKSKKTNRG